MAGRQWIREALKDFVFSFSQGAAAAAKTPGARSGAASLAASLQAPQLRQDLIQQRETDEADRQLKIQQIRQQLLTGQQDQAFKMIAALRGQQQPTQTMGADLGPMQGGVSKTIEAPIAPVNVPGMGNVGIPNRSDVAQGELDKYRQQQQIQAEFREPAAAPSGFALSPGQVRFGPDGQPIASVPAAPAAEKPIEQEWVVRGGVVTPITKGSAMPGDRPYEKTTAKEGPDDQIWVIRKGILTPIRKGTAQVGDKPYDEKADGAQVSSISPYALERSARTVQSVDELKKKVNGWTVGLGSVFKNWPTSAALEFKAELQTLKANIAFNELTAMREASKTGGALGNVSNVELNLLESALGALDQAQSAPQFTSQLDKIKASIDRWKKAAGSTPALAPAGVPADVDPAVWNVMTPQEKALWRN